MEMELTVDTMVRLSTGSGTLVGLVAGVERNDDETPFSVLIRSLQAEGISSLYFTIEEIDAQGWTLEPAMQPEPIRLAS